MFVRDRLAGTTERVSVGADGTEGDKNSAKGVISANGRFVAFNSVSTNLGASDTNKWPDVFVRDRVAKTTDVVSASLNG